jgi:hypothetical protein
VSVVLAIVVVLYVMTPLLVLIHELGHAAAVISTGRRPVVVIGKTPPWFARRFGSFDLAFHPRLPLSQFYPRTHLRDIPNGYAGQCRFDPAGLTVRQLRSIWSAGPQASVIVGLLLGVLAWFLPVDSVPFWISTISALLAFVDGFGNLIPHEREGRMFTDGARMARFRHLDGDVILAPVAEQAQHYPPRG